MKIKSKKIIILLVLLLISMVSLLVGCENAEVEDNSSSISKYTPDVQNLGVEDNSPSMIESTPDVQKVRVEEKSLSIIEYTPNVQNAAYISTINVKPLQVAIPVWIGVYRLSFLNQTGGIAFGKIAEPQNGLEVRSLKLYYDKSDEDGKRLKAEINGEKIIIPLYDWEIAPIFNYANSKYESCFSLFGTTGDKKQDEKIKEENSIKYFASYHTEFQDTLLGLRLLQMDAVLTNPNDIYCDIPKNEENGEKILGKGEWALPDISAIRNLSDIILKHDSYNAYVVCDVPVDIRFGIADDKFNMSGELYMWFWKFNKNYENDLINEAAERFNIVLDDNGMILSGSEYDILAAREWIDFNWDINNLEKSEWMDENIVVSMKELSDEIYDNISIIHAMNPNVYESVRKIMRYSAFFRYCKTEMTIDQWMKITEDISEINASPYVKLPNVVY